MWLQGILPINLENLIGEFKLSVMVLLKLYSFLMFFLRRRYSLVLLVALCFVSARQTLLSQKSHWHFFLIYGKQISQKEKLIPDD